MKSPKYWILVDGQKVKEFKTLVDLLPWQLDRVRYEFANENKMAFAGVEVVRVNG